MSEDIDPAGFINDELHDAARKLMALAYLTDDAQDGRLSGVLWSMAGILDLMRTAPDIGPARLRLVSARDIHGPQPAPDRCGGLPDQYALARG